VSEKPVVELDDVGFSFGRTPVLRGTTLTLAPGSLTVLVGVSGAGKTTLLRLCYLDLAPTEGRVRLFGRPVARRSRKATAPLRQAIGVLPQDRRMLEHLPLIDNVALPLRISGAAPEGRADDLRALLEWVGLANRADALPAELSGGERGRAALARAVILSPEIILADEPAQGADRESADALAALLIELHRMGKTVLVATHDRTLARSIAVRASARLLTLADGRLEPAELVA
jgi:cell division transport system ATP-binding protein